MLESRARTRSGGVAEAMRSKIVLSLAAGHSQAQTSRTVGCSVNTVRLWKERFVGERLGGLYGRHRGRSRSKESVRLEAKVLRLAQRKPVDGSTHWSTRKIAAEVGTNHVRVTRILAKAGLQPHRLRRYVSSNDPEFEEKAADIIGLYLKPPVNAAVFCVDEKSAIQALDRLDPVPIISRLIVPPRSGNSWSEIVMFASITHQPTPPGSTKLSSGFPKSSVMSSPAASSSRLKILIGNSSATSVATTNRPNPSSGLTPKLIGAFAQPRNQCNAALVSFVSFGEDRITAIKVRPRAQSARRAECRQRVKSPQALRRHRIPELVNRSFGPL